MDLLLGSMGHDHAYTDSDRDHSPLFMASPLRLFPTAAMLAVALERSVVSARQRIFNYVTKRDGPLKMAFKWFKPTDTAFAYGVTFNELVNDMELGVQELVDEGLITSWMDCVDLKITLQDVIPTRDEPRYTRCNAHVLKRLFGAVFLDHVGKDPLKIDMRSFANAYAARLWPMDCEVLKLEPAVIGAQLIKGWNRITPEGRANLSIMLAPERRAEWIKMGLPCAKLLALINS